METERLTNTGEKNDLSKSIRWSYLASLRRGSWRARNRRIVVLTMEYWLWFAIAWVTVFFIQCNQQIITFEWVAKKQMNKAFVSGIRQCLDIKVSHRNCPNRVELVGRGRGRIMSTLWGQDGWRRGSVMQRPRCSCVVCMKSIYTNKERQFNRYGVRGEISDERFAKQNRRLDVRLGCLILRHVNSCCVI